MKPECLSPLFGLVLGGGKSRRMGKSKMHICYHEVPQGLYCANLLSEHCQSVFLSIRSDQKEEVAEWKIPCIEDCWDDSGPMGGILSAFRHRNDAAWLAISCDMPFVTSETLKALIRARSISRMVTAYTLKPGFPEPFPAIYEASCGVEMQNCYRSGNYSLTSFIISAGFDPVEVSNPIELVNINTQEEYQAALQRLHKKSSSS